MSLITLLQTKQQRSTGLITDSLLQLKSFGYQRHTLACLTHMAWLSSESSCGLHQRLETLKVWASTAQVNKTSSDSYFSLVILVLADEIFAEDINIWTHTHCSSHISMDDVRHVRDAINTWPRLISYITRLIQLHPEDYISRELSSAAAGHFLCISVCVCVSFCLAQIPRTTTMLQLLLVCLCFLSRGISPHPRRAVMIWLISDDHGWTELVCLYFLFVDLSFDI